MAGNMTTSDQTHSDSISVCKLEYGTFFGSTTRQDPSHLVCDAITQNGADHDAPNANDNHEMSENRGDDVENMLVGTSLSAGHEHDNLVFDFVFESSCAGFVLVIAYNLLQWYCCPKKPEERPTYLCRRCELETLNAKLKLSCVSTRVRHC
eukprot:SAG31_NODE_5818_length_2310_cov_2.984622_3_plen_150_part_01